MDRTAGFAASLAIRQELLQTLVRVLYNAGKIDHYIGVTLPTLSTNIFLGLPAMSFPAGTPGKMAIDLYGWGPLAVTPPGSPVESRKVKFRVRVLVQMTATLVPMITPTGATSKLVLGFDSSTLSAINLQIDPYTGGLFSPAAVAYLQSPEFLALLTLGLQVKAGDLAMAIPPLDMIFLGAIATDPMATVRVTTVEGALLLGIDLHQPGYTTHGDVNALTDTSAGNQVGIWTRPSVIQFAYGFIETKIRDAVAEAGATLDGFHIGVEEGWLKVIASASATGGSANIDFQAEPRLVRPAVTYEWDEEYGEHFSYTIPARDDLWFEATEVHVDVDRAWWAVLLEVLTLGIAAAVVETMVMMIRGNATNQITQDQESLGTRNQTFTIAGVSRPLMNLRIEEYEAHTEGVFIGLTMKPQFWRAQMTGINAIGVEEALQRPVTFRVELPPDALFDDPELRIRWTLRRTDTNEVLLTQDTVFFGRQAIQFNSTIVPYLAVDRLSIEARVYRTLGVGTEEIFTELQYVRISDYVDRTHPFIQWTHQAMVPLVEVEPDGTHTELGLHMVARRSAIHRTAIPGRCRMLRHYSTTKLFPRDGLGFFPPDYTDALPFPLEDILAYRAQLCDYCFFGGPTKDIPLIPLS
ncbi:MAG: hypothetical protein ABI679_08705 [Gemmatimonadota bacterium]